MFQNIQLEMSLKSFYPFDEPAIRRAARTVFEQWRPLAKDAPTVSIMLWTADGSEILDYKGNLAEPFEWSYYFGGNLVGKPGPLDPEGITLNTRRYLFTENPGTVTYNTLKTIVAVLRQVGAEILGEKKIIRVGETFDVGPEFAKSSFKYERHNEICMGGPSPDCKIFICSYATLHADTISYAGFPNGIPEGLPFGTFFGRQAQHFLSDLGFDFIWFSNGLGFGRDPWSATGAIFDGTQFLPDRLDSVKQVALDFWTLFTKECTYPIETRGTNMSTGIDMATDAIPLRAVYQQNPSMLPPPNSPWAALNGDYGLELMGYMSHIAEIPKDRYLFRFYLHDPWWDFSPWYDCYDSQPHDIYLPLACARIDENGCVQPPTDLSLLSIDNVFGELPDACANEPIPHFLKGIKDAPTAPSPFVWVYPFHEYSIATEGAQLNDMFAEDWYIRGAINNGFPLSSVTSTDSFLRQDLSIYSGSVLVTPVPQAGSAVETKLLHYAQNGGKIIFYGRADRASDAFLQLINVRITEDGIDGEWPVTVNGTAAGTLKTDALISAGKLNTVLRDVSGQAYPLAEAGGKVIATAGQNVIWLRATVSADYTGAPLLRPHDHTKYFISETLLLQAAEHFGWTFLPIRAVETSKAPVVMLARSDNALMLSTFSDDTTVKLRLRTPLGVPLFIGWSALFQHGEVEYAFPKSTHLEGRVFVEQESGCVSVREVMPRSMQVRRRVSVSGLQDATVRFFFEDYCKDSGTAVLNALFYYWITGDEHNGHFVTDNYGTYYEMNHVTGTVTLSMPRRDLSLQDVKWDDSYFRNFSLQK